MTEPLQVVGDPRLPATAEDYRKQYELLLKIRNKLTETHDAVNRIREVREQVKTVGDHAKAAGGDEAIAKAAEALTKSVTSVEEALYQTKNQSNQDPLNFPIRLNNKLSALAGSGGERGRRADGVVLRGLRGRGRPHRRGAREAAADPRQGPGRVQPARAREGGAGGGAQEARGGPVRRDVA